MKESKKLKLKSVEAWFWFCPVYWDRETGTLFPRFKLSLILEFTLLMHHTMLFIASFFNLDIEPCYPIKISGYEFEED